jgi:hypothetical protein
VEEDRRRSGGAAGKGQSKGGKGKGTTPYARNDSGKGGKGGKGFGGKGAFLGKCFNCGESGHRKQDCTKMDVRAVDGWGTNEQIVTYQVESIWDIGAVEATHGTSGWLKKGSWLKKKKVEPQAPKTWNRFQALQEDDETTGCMVCGVDPKDLTREAQLEFCEADVRKPLVSAVRVAKAGNGMWLEANGGYVMNMATEENIIVRVENGVYVMDVQFDDDTVDVVTLDSGAGCNVWPKGRRAGSNSKLLPKRAGVGMVAANGTPIEYHGQRQVRFRGMRTDPGFPGPR